MDIYKDQLPSGWSYALRPSVLERAVADAGIMLPVSLHQRHKLWAADAPAFSATFYPIGSHLGGEHGLIAITSAAVPADQRKSVQPFAETTFLPALLRWIGTIEKLSKNSPVWREGQAFSCDGSPSALPARTIGSISKGQRRRQRA